MPTLHIPGSKSLSNRVILLAALANGTSHLTNIQISDDIRALTTALSTLGIPIQLNEQEKTATITGCNGNFPNKNATLHCNESGTLARFLITACAASTGTYSFDAATSLRNRPMHTLVKTLTDMNVHCSAESLPFTIKSLHGLPGGSITIDASQTGQVVSALLIAAPLMKSPLTLTIKNCVSRPYIDLTCWMMAEFGVQVEYISETEFFVPQSQHYCAKDYNVEPDLSTAAYFFAAAAIIGTEITIADIDRIKAKQGDIMFLSILEQMGCTVRQSDAGVSVAAGTNLQGIEVNMKDWPDIFMTLAAIAPYATTPTIISGIHHTRFKESDRIAAMCHGLSQLGVKVELRQDYLKIYPADVHPGHIITHNDHRIAMSFAIMSLRTPGITLDNPHCVTKSCPEFFQLLRTAFPR